MKALIVLSLTLALMGGAYSQRLGLFEDREKVADRAETVKEDRFKDNEALEEAEREKDRFKSDINSGAQDTLKISEDFETILDFKDFEDIAHKNDLSKSNKFAVQIVDDSSHDESNAFQSSKGTSLKTGVSSSKDFASDSAVFDNEEIIAESDSERQKAKAREAAGESIFGDSMEHLLDRGTRLHFEDLGHDDHHDIDDGFFSGLGFFNGGGRIFDRFRSIRTSRGLHH